MNIDLSPSPVREDYYSSISTGKFETFTLDGQGPFRIEVGKKLVVRRDEDGVFDSFEWVDFS